MWKFYSAITKSVSSSQNFAFLSLNTISHTCLCIQLFGWFIRLLLIILFELFEWLFEWLNWRIIKLFFMKLFFWLFFSSSSFLSLWFLPSFFFYPHFHHSYLYPCHLVELLLFFYFELLLYQCINCILIILRHFNNVVPDGAFLKIN